MIGKLAYINLLWLYLIVFNPTYNLEYFIKNNRYKIVLRKKNIDVFSQNIILYKCFLKNKTLKK